MQGGQKGHPGASLAWSARPDETLVIEPGTCGGCGTDLAGAPSRIASSVQVPGIPPAVLTVTEYQTMCRTCGCGQVTTAPPPPGVTGGPVCYGPKVTAAATLLASTDVIGIERAADLMGALLGAPVSTGFFRSRCLVRLDAASTAARFGDAASRQHRLGSGQDRHRSAGREDPGVLDRRQFRRGNGPSCLARLAGRAFCVLLWGLRAHPFARGVDSPTSASRHPKLDNPGSAGDDEEQDAQYCGEKERRHPAAGDRERRRS